MSITIGSSETQNIQIEVSDSQSVQITDSPTQLVSIEAAGRGPTGLPGAGLAAGGEVGQLIAKASTTDYDTEWTSDINVTSIDISSGNAVLSWNDQDGTIDVAYANGVTLQVGQEQHFYAKATEPIDDGDIVMFVGAQGSHSLIAKADMSSPSFFPQAVMGVATQSFVTNEFGYVTSFGKVRGIDLSDYENGDLLYLDPDNAGKFVTTAPTPPNHAILVAAVADNKNNGTMLVRLTHLPDTDEIPEGSTNLYYTDARADARIAAAKLRDIGNVLSSTATPSNSILAYNQALDLWLPTLNAQLSSINASSATFTTVSVAQQLQFSSGGGNVIGAGIGTDDLLIESNGNVTVLLDKDGDETNQKFIVADSASSNVNETKFSVDENGDTYVAGNVGIGTVTPSSKFHVVGSDSLNDSYSVKVSNSSASDVFSLENNGDFTLGVSGAKIVRENGANVVKVNAGNAQVIVGTEDVKLAANFTGKILFQNSYTNNAVFTNDGKFGIGTTTPTDRLDVSGNLRLVNTQDYIKFANDLNTIKRDGANAMRFDSYGGFKFHDTNNNAERVRIDASGNVGIGTTSPAYKLDVNGDIGLSGDIVDTNTGEKIEIGTNDIRAEHKHIAAEFGLWARSSTLSSRFMGIDGSPFFMGLFTDGDEKVRISQTGNVGIGTTSPRGKLDARGRVDFSQDLRLRGTDALEDQGVARFYVDNTNKLYIDTGNNGSDLFAIDGSGNVGIGTTTPTAKLDVYGGESRFGTDQLGYVQILGNGGGGVVKSNKRLYLETFGGYDMDLKSTGNYNFKNNAATTYVHFDGTNERVGIGTTSPESSLHIAGTTGITMGRNSAQNQVARVYADAADNLILTAASGSGKVIKLNNYVFGNTIDWAFTNSTGNKLDFTLTPNGWGGSNAPSLASFNSSVGYSTGDWKMVKIENTLNQSGDAAFTDLFINRTENSTGTGNQLFIDAQTNSVSKFSVDSQGKVTPQSIRFDGTINSGVTFQRDSYGVKIVGDSVGTIGTFKGSANLISWSQPTAWGGVGVASTGRVGIKAHNGASTPFFVQDYGNNPLLYTTVGTGGLDGKVGIGTTTPTEKLHVVGKATINDGSNNVLISSGNSTITASNTTAIGYRALTALTTGEGNTAVGLESLRDTTTGIRNTVVGNSAGAAVNSSYNAIYGYQAGQLFSGNNNTAMGYVAGKYSSGGNNVLIGAEAGEGVSATSTFSNTTAVGYQALTALTTGNYNTAVGYQAGNTITGGSGNTLVGYSVGGGNYTNTTLIGYDANSDGNYAVAIGWLAKASHYSTAVGTLAGGNSSNAEFNVFVGDSAGRFNSGDRNVIIGRSAGYNSGTSSDNIFLGYQAGYNETGSNKLYIENSNSTTPLIYGEFDNDILRVNGTLQVGDPTGTGFALPSTDGTANQVLSTDGSGVVTWVDQSGGGAATGAEIGFAYKTTNQTLTGTFTAISAFDGEFFDELTAFDPTTGALTITDVGHYLINIDVMSNVTAGTGRSGSEIYLEFNGSEVAGSRRGMYNRNSISGYTSASITFPYYHSTGTATFKVMAAQTSGTDTVIIDNCTFSYSTLGGTQGPQGVSGDAFAVSIEAAGRTLVAGDHLKYLRSTSATAVTFTVPPQSSVSWVDNAEIVFEQAGAGQITIAAGSGVTINSSETLKSGQQYAVIGLKRVASDTWTLTGERELAP